MLGETYFRRAFRLSYGSFLELHRRLSNAVSAASRKYMSALPHHVPNGKITTSVRLGCALRYFSGGSPYDICCSFGISHTEVLDSVSYVVDAVNDVFRLSYPSLHDEQRAIADDFRQYSGADFGICAGAIDGLLIWIGKPTPADCEEMRCDSGKFFCGRKNKFGLNCQAVADRRGRILDLSITFPGSTSDCLAFEASSLYQRLNTNGFLAEGLCLFGDSTYLNAPYMATPFTGATAGSVDAYNFYHSQLRIRVECAFGMLTERWAILRTAIPRNTPVRKTIAIVCALAKLHNFCIEQVDEECHTIPPEMSVDSIRHEILGAVPLVLDGSHDQAVPIQLIGAGHHLDDYPRNNRRAHARQFQGHVLPRERLLQLIQEIGYTRPPQVNR